MSVWRFIVLLPSDDVQMTGRPGQRRILKSAAAGRQKAKPSGAALDARPAPAANLFPAFSRDAFRDDVNGSHSL